MPYQKSTAKAFDGGLNLLAPGTHMPEGDLQKCVNGAWDAMGALKTRMGMSLDGTASGEVLQIFMALDAKWQVTTASICKNYATLVPLTNAWAAGYKNYVWGMGEGQEPKKTNGTDVWRWIPEPPEDECTAKTAEEAITEIDDLTGGWETDQDDEDDDQEDLEYDDDGIRLSPSSVTVYSLTKEVSLDLYTGHDIDDLVRIKLRAKWWTKIGGFTLEFDFGDGSFTDNYVSCRMPVKELKGARKETKTFYMRKRPLDVDVEAANKFKYPHFERVGSAPDEDWRNVVAIRMKIEFLELTRFWIKGLDMVGDEDSVIEGDDLKYWVTYTTDDGHESNPGPESKPIHAIRSSIELTDLPVSSDPQVTGKNIYTNRGGSIYRINEEPVDNADTSYTDTESDDDLTERGIEMEEDHDDPPEAEGVVGPFNGRLIAWKGVRVYWTKIQQPWVFVAPDEDGGEWNDLDEDIDGIQAMVLRADRVNIYGRNGMYILVGDPGNASGYFHKTALQMGIPGRTAVCIGGPDTDFAVMNRGLYSVAGGSANKLSDKMEPLFVGRSVTLDDGTIATPISDFETIAVGYDNGVVWVGYDNSKTIKFHLASGRWFQDTRNFSCFGHLTEGFMGGQVGGQVQILDEGTTDNGAAISFDFISRTYDCGTPDSDKTFEDITLEMEGSATATLYIDGVAYALGAIGGGAYARDVIQINGGNGIAGRNASVQVTGSGQVVFRKFHLNYKPEARQAKTYDTDETDCGTHKAKLVREIYADMENDASVSLSLLTDQPGFAMSARAAATISAVGSRRWEPVVFVGDIIGRNVRALLTSASASMQVYGLKILSQVIGTYLHGTKGEYWLSDAIDFGTERIKLLREIEVVYSSTSPSVLRLKTDMPSGTLTANVDSPFGLPSTTGEETLKIRVEAQTLGRLFEVRVEPEGDLRLEAIRMRIKIVGEPHATGWTWVDLPVEATADGRWFDVTIGPDALA